MAPQLAGQSALDPGERAIAAMRRQLAEARVSWGKGEADVALRAAKVVATRIRVHGGGGGVEGRGGGEREEQCLLSEVGSRWSWGVLMSGMPSLLDH